MTILLALCSFLVFMPMMLGIMAGMTLVDSCIEEYTKIGPFWEMTSFVSVFGSSVRQWIHIYVSLQWPGLWFRSCSSSLVVEFPVVVQRPFPMSTETPLLLLNTVIDVPVAQVVQVRTSSVAPCIWQSLVRCSVFAFGVQEYGNFWEVSVCYTPWFGSGYMFGNFTRFLRDGDSTVVAPVVVHDMCRMVQTMQNCLEVPQVQFLRVCGRRCVHAATSSRQSWDGVQFRSSTRS